MEQITEAGPKLKFQGWFVRLALFDNVNLRFIVGCLSD
jgi:hypothetical protein